MKRPRKRKPWRDLLGRYAKRPTDVSKPTRVSKRKSSSSRITRLERENRQLRKILKKEVKRRRKLQGVLGIAKGLKRKSSRHKAVRRLKYLLLKEGKIKKGAGIAYEYIPLTGLLRAAWLEQNYAEAISLLLLQKRTSGTVEAIFPIIGGRKMSRSIPLDPDDGEVFFLQGSGEQLSPEHHDGKTLIDGFLLRIDTNQPF